MESIGTWLLIQRLGTETDVYSLANLGGGVVLAGTGPTGQIYRYLMKIIDVYNELYALNLIAGTFTADTNGIDVDLQGYQGVLKVILNSGAGGGTTPTLDAKIQDSADNSVFADIPDKVFIQVTDAGMSIQVLGIDTRTVKRYIRVALAITGTSPTFGLAVTAVGQKQIM